MNDRLQNGNGKPIPSEQKLRGGYYTPPAIAHFLAAWAIRDKKAAVLEPSCGEGSLVAPAMGRLGKGGRLVGVELFSSAAAVAQSVAPLAEIHQEDAFGWFAKNPELTGSFDAALGNPPFIRYQSFPEEHREAAFSIMRSEGLHPTRLTNAWVPFVVLATAALRPGGRLALVLPAELLQVGYAGELREYLARKYQRLTIVAFDELVFPDIQQETVLLLGERGDSESALMSVIEARSATDLPLVNADTAPPVEVDLEHSREKWTQYYLDAREIDLIREIEAAGFPMLGQLCDVRVGVVTGRNDFFVLDPSTAESLGLAEWTTRLVGRSSQIPGLQLSTADWEGLRYRNERCLLLNLRHDTRSALPARALAYVEEGERLGIHEGYKCRIRLPNWWHVPSMWVPDAFLLRQIHTGPRIVANGAGAECTDTIHRVRCHPGVSAEALAACSVNSMTWAFSEIRGRSYGGGVLELEPREACALPFPRPSASMPVDELNGLAMTGDTDALLRRVDELTLLPLGVSASEVRMLEAIWRRLSGRRLGRRP